MGGDGLLGASGGFLVGFGHDFGEGDFGAVATFAFVGGFHEGVDFEGFFGGDGSDAGAEEVDDLVEQRLVAIEATDFSGLAFGVGGGARVAFAGVAGFAEDAGAIAVPGAGDLDFAIVGGAAFDGEAAGAHGGEEGFDSVDAIPEEVGVGGFEGGVSAVMTLPMLPWRTAWVFLPKRREEEEKMGVWVLAAALKMRMASAREPAMGLSMKVGLPASRQGRTCSR